MVWALSLRNRNTIGEPRVYYIQLNREAGLLCTAEQGYGVITHG